MIYEPPFISSLIVSLIPCVSKILTMIWGKYYFFLVCTFKKTIDDVEAKVDVQKRPLGLGKILTKDLLIMSKSHFHSLSSYGNKPQ
jgi:hypothetical protein